MGLFSGTEKSIKRTSEVMSELMSLQGVLSTLRDHLRSLHYDGNLGNLSALEILDQPDGALATCNAVPLDVLAILEGL